MRLNTLVAAAALAVVPAGCSGPAGLTERPPNPDCVAFPRPQVSGGVQLERAFPQVSIGRTTVLAEHPDGDSWLLVAQVGRVLSFTGDEPVRLVVDLQDRVWSGSNEAGLLGMAVHPRFAENGQVFLSYTTKIGRQTTSRISRFTSADGLATIDASSEEVLIELAQPYDNHNGGDIDFGPDGFLYVALGDGGAGGDPLGSGQDPSTLLGSILRIDVDKGAPYGIPADNPFAGGGGRGEIFAWGLRNPWRMDFDPDTGELWVGDVGQNAMEEVDIVRLGGNYGWNAKEGTACFRQNPCDEGGWIDPVAEYPNPGLGRSITGGVVVRGGKLPGFEGAFLYTDYVSGRLWAVERDGDTGAYTSRLVIDGTGLRVATFARSADGRVFLSDHAGGGIYELKSVGGETIPAPPTLSATGCADGADVTAPAAGLVPYELNHPFWSDGAVKQRWMGLPDGQVATVAADGDLRFPPGTVLRKDFVRGGERISTRLMVHHEDGWAGYVYRWRADGSDADLVNGLTAEAGGGPWHFPSGAACVSCHTEAAGRALGPESAQLARMLDYGDGKEVSQLEVLDRIGLVEGLDLAAEPLPAVDEPGGARAWLHANCAPCHRPDAGSGEMDLRFTTPLAALGACDVPAKRGDVGLADARLIAPGAPERSVLLARIRDRGAWRMPPEGSLVVDETGAAAVEAWIASLDGCD